jgi:hypothetical protein
MCTLLLPSIRYIPANSNLLFDIEIIGKKGKGKPEKAVSDRDL